MNTRSTVITTVLLSCALAGGLPAHAAGGITLDPSVIRLTMKPGEIWRGSVRVSDSMSDPVTLVPSTANISRSTESDVVDLAGDITTRLGTLAAWVHPAPGSLIVPAGGSAALEFVIQVPENASPGSHKGLLVLTVAPSRPQDNALAATTAIALGIDLTVVGQPNHHIALSDVSVGPWLGSKPPIQVRATLVNTGNTLPVEEMQATISNLWGSFTAVAMSPENGSAMIAPGTQTLFGGTWDGTGLVPAGIFKLRVTAHDSAGDYEASRYFILVPWQLLLGILLAAAVIALGRRLGAPMLGKRRSH